MKANLICKHWSGDWITRSSTEFFLFNWDQDLSLRGTCHSLVDLSGALLTVEHLLPISYYFLATGEMRLIFIGLIPPSAKVDGDQWKAEDLLKIWKAGKFFAPSICEAMWEHRGAWIARDRMLHEYAGNKYGGPCKNSFTK